MVTLYSKPNCPKCMATRRDLDKLEVKYKYVDVSEDFQAYTYLKSLGVLSMPYIVTENESWSGYKPGRIKALAASDSE